MVKMASALHTKVQYIGWQKMIVYFCLGFNHHNILVSGLHQGTHHQITKIKWDSVLHNRPCGRVFLIKVLRFLILHELESSSIFMHKKLDYPSWSYRVVNG